MKEGSTDALIRELRRGLGPIRPIPPLRIVVAAISALVVPGWFWVLWRAGGTRPGLLILGTTDPVFTSIGAGMVLLGIGGLVGAAALAIPGREGGARAALGVAAAGTVLAFVVGLAFLIAEPAPLHRPGAADLDCLARGLLVGAATSLAGVRFVSRAAPRHKTWTAALAIAAGAALGGLAVHVTCPSPDAQHWFLAHAGAPVVAALVVGPLAGILLRHRGA